jgi:hypothetical protein
VSGVDPALDPTAETRPIRSSRLRLAVEFVVLFVGAMLLKHLVVGGSGSPYPNPLWLPVIVLSLEHGLAAGLTATLVATGLQFSEGIPPAHITEDMYGYVGRIAAEPIAWACVSLLIGHIRSQQIAEVQRLQTDLSERDTQNARVSELCADLRGRAEMLERQIAANARSSNVDVAEAIRGLNDATWESFAERLTRFVLLMTGTAEFAVYLLRDNVLKVVFQPNDEHTAAGDVTISPDDPLFDAVVGQRRTLSALRAGDKAALRERAFLAGPLMDPHAGSRVIGMLSITGGALDDHPDDIDRRFALTQSEISGVLGRIILIDRWHAAVGQAEANGHHEASGPSSPAGVPPPAAPSVAGEATLQ